MTRNFNDTAARLHGVLIFLTAAAGVFYAVVVAYQMTFYFGNATFWFGLTSGVYLFFRHLGAAWNWHLSPDRRKNFLWRKLIYLHVIGGGSVLWLYLSYVFCGLLPTGDSAAAALSGFGLCAIIILADIGFLSGCSVTLLDESRLEVSVSPRRRSSLWAGLGALGGAAGFLWGIQRFEALTMTLGLAVLFLSLIFLILLILRVKNKKRKVPAGMALAALVLFASGLCYHQGILQYFLKDFYHNLSATYGVPASFSTAGKYFRVERYRDGGDRIDIIRVPEDILAQEMPINQAYGLTAGREAAYPYGYMFFFNRRFMMRTDHQAVHNEYFVHVPVVVNGRVPARVLVLDFGAGLIARELLKYPGVQEITQVPLSRGLARLARRHPLLMALNDHALDDPRCRVVMESIDRFLRTDAHRYDAVYMDLPVGDSYRFSRFYSREFFELIKKRLSKDGYFVLQAPGSGIFSYFDEEGRQAWVQENKWPVYRQTLRAAGYQMVVPYVANLEIDFFKASGKDENPLAQSSSKEANDIVGLLTEEKVRDLAVREGFREFAYALQEGFIMARADKGALSRDTRLLPRDLRVLNPPRVALAFQLKYPPGGDRDRRFIHSLKNPKWPGVLWRNW